MVEINPSQVIENAAKVLILKCKAKKAMWAMGKNDTVTPHFQCVLNANVIDHIKPKIKRDK